MILFFSNNLKLIRDDNIFIHWNLKYIRVEPFSLWWMKFCLLWPTTTIVLYQLTYKNIKTRIRISCISLTFVLLLYLPKLLAVFPFGNLHGEQPHGVFSTTVVRFQTKAVWRFGIHSFRDRQYSVIYFKHGHSGIVREA